MTYYFSSFLYSILFKKKSVDIYFEKAVLKISWIIINTVLSAVSLIAIFSFADYFELWEVGLPIIMTIVHIITSVLLLCGVWYDLKKSKQQKTYEKI